MIRVTKPESKAEWAAVIAVALFGTMAAIQIGIACGLLPSDIVWGGANDSLSLQASMASLAACVILCGMAYIIHRRTQPMPSKFNRGASWFIAFYMGLNTLGNLLGKTWVEQYVFGSMTLALCICSCVVATSQPLGLDVSREEEGGVATASTPLSGPLV